MATEYRLSYTGTEVNERLRAVGELRTSLERDYDISTKVDEKITNAVNNVSTTLGTSIQTLETSLETKADLVDGKIPLEQIPDDVGGAVSWNDLEDKPFYDNSTSFKMPYDVSDCTKIYSQPVSALEGISFTFVKLSDAYADAREALYGATIDLSFGHDIINCTLSENEVLDCNGGFGVLLVDSNGVIPMCISANTPGTFVFPASEYYGEDFTFNVSETGLYFLYMPEVETYVTSYRKGVIKQIDPKFIPANLDFDLSDYYTKVEVDNVIDSRFYEIDGILGDCNSVLNEINALIGE